MKDAFPNGWTKTIADLLAESNKTGSPINAEESEWAFAYERSLLRPWARFPLDGDIYEAIDETPVSFLTHWRAPFTDGGTGTLPRATRIQVTVVPSIPEPIRVYASPIERDVIEQLLVPESVRKADKYNGFSLSISTRDLNERFRLVSSL